MMKLKLFLAVTMLTAIVSYPASSQTTTTHPAPPPKPRPATPQATAHSQPPQTVAGFWAQVGDDGKIGGWFYFTQRSDGLFDGRLVKMIKQPGDQPQPMINVCAKCEGDQKDAPMLGLTIVKGMKRDGNKYEEGSILDPRDGTLYHALMEMSGDGQKLAVRGYLGIPLLGQTQVWQRLPDDSIAPPDIPPESHGPNATAQ
jgi:uncharacterized protein (DUF2147 family)